MLVFGCQIVFSQNFASNLKTRLKLRGSQRFGTHKNPQGNILDPRNTHEGTIAQYHQTPETHNAT